VLRARGSAVRGYYTSTSNICQPVYRLARDRTYAIYRKRRDVPLYVPHSIGSSSRFYAIYRKRRDVPLYVPHTIGSSSIFFMYAENLTGPHHTLFVVPPSRYPYLYDQNDDSQSYCDRHASFDVSTTAATARTAATAVLYATPYRTEYIESLARYVSAAACPSVDLGLCSPLTSMNDYRKYTIFYVCAKT
jgi:hypothetical protein